MIDLTGQVFGRLTVVSLSGKRGRRRSAARGLICARLERSAWRLARCRSRRALFAGGVDRALASRANQEGDQAQRRWRPGQ
jgi:hypothetical protein